MSDKIIVTALVDRIDHTHLVALAEANGVRISEMMRRLIKNARLPNESHIPSRVRRARAKAAAEATAEPT